MTYQEAYNKLAAYEQTHVLKYYDSLSKEEQKELLEQIEATDFEVVNSLSHMGENKKGKITPLTFFNVNVNESRNVVLIFVKYVNRQQTFFTFLVYSS